MRHTIITKNKCCLSFILLCLLLSNGAFAQPQKVIDSIERLLPSQKDSVLAASYNELTWQYRKVDRAKAMEYGERAIALSKKIDYPKGESQAYNDLGIIYMDAQDFDASLKSYAKAIPIRKRLNDKKGLAAVYLKIGIVYHQWGKFDMALENGQLALKIYEEIKDDFGIATALNNLGNANTGLGNSTAALVYFEKSLAIRQRIEDKPGIAACYLNIGKVYFNEKDMSKALSTLKIADSLATQSNSYEVIATAAHNLAGIYDTLGPYNLGIPYIEKAYSIREQMKDEKAMMSSLVVWGSLLTKLKDYKQAEEKLMLGLTKADTTDANRLERGRIYRQLNTLYEATGDYRNANDMAKRLVQINESIYTADLNKHFAEVEIKYESAVKSKEIQRQQFEITKRNYLIAGIFALLLLGTLLAYSYYRRLKLKKDRQIQATIIHQQDIASRGIIEAEERERKRIAGDLHDGLGQLFSAVKMNMNIIGKNVHFNDEETATSFEKTMSLVDESCKEVRSISHQMMPNTLLKYGLASAVRDFINNIDTRQLKVNLEISGLNERLDSNTETVLYRVLQETVNNVIKHSGASKLDIQLSKDEDGVTATIEDNGKGFDKAETDLRDGIGLKNIRTRVEFLKGSVEFDSTPGRGTVVSVWVPAVPLERTA